MPDEIVAPEAPQSSAEIEAARQAFLGSPPPILDPSETPAVPAASDAEEQAAIDEILGATKPPAGPEGAGAPGSTAPAPAPAQAGTPDPFAQWGGQAAVQS